LSVQNVIVGYKCRVCKFYADAGALNSTPTECPGCGAGIGPGAYHPIYGQLGAKPLRDELVIPVTYPKDDSKPDGESVQGELVKTEFLCPACGTSVGSDATQCSSCDTNIPVRIQARVIDANSPSHAWRKA